MGLVEVVGLPCGGPQAALSYTPQPVHSQDSAVKVRNSNSFSTGGNSSAPVYLHPTILRHRLSSSVRWSSASRVSCMWKLDGSSLAPHVVSPPHQQAQDNP